MHDSSIFNLTIDFEKSHDSYLLDKLSQESYLDFFGLYATLPLGYNHPIFQTEEFRKEYNRVASVKVSNCEMASDEAREFLKTFRSHASMKPFSHFHFCCTGALAIEASIKIAMDHKPCENPMVLSLKESFHGINAYGGFVTDRFEPVNQRLNGFPQMDWIKLVSPKIVYNNNQIDEKESENRLHQFKKEFENALSQYGKKRIVAFVIEPIQSTYGDNYFPQDFFDYVRKQCSQNDIALIFDEIQVGFGTTGKMWYFEHLGIIPDIVVFGKKTQTSGVMVQKKFAQTFDRPIRLEVTWDGDLTDMIRCKYILKAYQQYNILDNVNQRSRQLFDGLRGVENIKNLRSKGLLFAFDFESIEKRDSFFDKAVKNRFLCNRTRDRSVRLRPNLNVSPDEINSAISIIKKAAEGFITY